MEEEQNQKKITINKEEIEVIKPYTYYDNFKHDMIIYQNHLFTQRAEENVDSDKSMIPNCVNSYECCFRKILKCNVKLYELENGDYEIIGDHNENCIDQMKSKYRLIRIKEMVYDIVLDNQNERSKNIMATITDKYSIDERMPQHKTIKNIINNTKENLGGKKIRNYIEYIENPMKTKNGELYKMEIINYELSKERLLDHEDTSGFRKPEMLLVMSPFQKMLIRIVNKMMISDGTFQFVPSGIYQIYSLHLAIGSTTYPICHVFMNHNTKEAYMELFKYLQNTFEFNPKSAVMDFERSSRASFNIVFNDKKVFGCTFHFGNALQQNLKHHGLYKYYKKDNDLYLIIKSITGLQYVDVEQINDLFQLIEKKATEVNDNIKSKVHDFILYVKRTWIGYTEEVTDKNGVKRTVRREPYFRHSQWNCTCHLEKRSSNDAEAFHRTYNDLFHRSHPNFDEFRENIIVDDEERVKKFLFQCKEEFKSLNLSEDENPFKEGKYSNENNCSINYNMRQIEDCVNIINKHQNIFIEKEEEVDEFGKEILEIRKNYQLGRYSNDKFRYLCDLGRVNIRSIIKRELKEIDNHLNYLSFCPDNQSLRYAKQAAQLRKEEILKMLDGEKQILLPRTYSTEEIEIVTEISNSTKLKMKVIKEMHREVSTDLKKTTNEYIRKKKGTKHNPRMSQYLGKDYYPILKQKLDNLEIANAEINSDKISRKRTIPLNEDGNYLQKRSMNERRNETQILSTNQDAENNQITVISDQGIESQQRNLFISEEDNYMNINVNDQNMIETQTKENQFEDIENSLEKEIQQLREAEKMIRKSDSLHRFITSNRENEESGNETIEKKESKSKESKKKTKKKKRDKIIGPRKKICTYCQQQYYPGCCERTLYCLNLEDKESSSKKSKKKVVIQKKDTQLESSES